MFCRVVAFLALLTAFVRAIPIDNGVVGEPEISCGPNSITVNFNTENAWEGQLYVKNHYAENGDCVVKGTGRDRLASIELDFDQCGVVRERSLQPRGVNVYVTVIMSFHEKFLTKVDRAVRAKCFYMEADKTVSQEIEVSMLTTDVATFNVPMPVCRYDIKETDDLDSEPVKFAIVGQSVWHHWICDTDYDDTFCSYPYGCFVTDGSGDEQEVVQLLDDDGCFIDLNLIAQPEYPGDLWARVESHVFKYADRPDLYFNCQMRVTIKEPGQDCPRPQCSGRRGRRGKRSSDAMVTDVSVPRGLLVADVDFTENDVPKQRTHPFMRPAAYPQTPVFHAPPAGVCVSPSLLGMFLAVVVLLCCIGLTIVAITCTRRAGKF